MRDWNVAVPAVLRDLWQRECAIAFAAIDWATGPSFTPAAETTSATAIYDLLAVQAHHS